MNEFDNQGDFLVKVWEAERLVTLGKNADMYRQLRMNGSRFGDETWDFGVNSLFLGPAVFEQITTSRILHGKKFPEDYKYRGRSFGQEIDRIRAIEIVHGKFMPPQNWEELFAVAENLRMVSGEWMEYSRQQLGKVSEEQLKRIMKLAEDGVNLYTRPEDVDISDMLHALVVKRETIHMQELGTALDIIATLKKEGLLTEPVENNGDLLEFR